MRKKLIAIFLVSTCLISSFVGCGKKEEEQVEYENGYATPDDFEPMYYMSEEELPENAYYIVHKDTVEEQTKDGKTVSSKVTKYYPLHQAQKTYDKAYEDAAGYDPTRVTWVNYNEDEGLIPTMYAGDKLIYKSSTYIPTKYALEKFFDEGYTLGVCGLAPDLSGNYKYVSSANNSGTGYVMPTSDAIGFDGLEAESIYLVAVGKKRVTALNTSLSGTITGLKLMEKYPCDIRTGTEKIAADMTCNIHYFSSAENYMFGSFTFITDIIAELNIPFYVTSGYYNINGGGFFRYLGDMPAKTNYKKLKAADYNDTIYTYDDEGKIDGTTIGLVFDENDFLVVSTEVDETGEPITAEEKEIRTYEDVVDDMKITSSITNVTSQKVSEDGTYTGKYSIIALSEPIVNKNSTVYTMKVMDTKTGENLDFKYTYKAKGTKPEMGKEYTIVFTEAGNSFDGYAIISIKPTKEKRGI